MPTGKIPPNLHLINAWHRLSPGQALKITASNGAALTARLRGVDLEHNSALLNGNWSGIGLFAEARGVNSALDLDLENCRIRDNVGDNDQRGGGGVTLSASKGGIPCRQP